MVCNHFRTFRQPVMHCVLCFRFQAAKVPIEFAVSSWLVYNHKYINLNSLDRLESIFHSSVKMVYCRNGGSISLKDMHLFLKFGIYFAVVTVHLLT